MSSIYSPNVLLFDKIGRSMADEIDFYIRVAGPHAKNKKDIGRTILQNEVKPGSPAPTKHYLTVEQVKEVDLQPSHLLTYEELSEMAMAHDDFVRPDLSQRGES
jgi:plasmid stability protein